ncbi:MAG: diguanylate cyclase [Planctomycetaceae bacterium]|nr:diguanylate cyclase [Planctomycetaceae bacterium]
MQVHQSSLSLSAPSAPCDHVVPAGMTLEQVVDRIQLDGPGHLLVAHEDGSLAGVISTEELLLRMSAADAVERLKWSRRPIESILSAVITPVAPAAIETPTYIDIPAPPESLSPWPCTAYFHRGRLQAVSTDDDVLLSWKSIEPFLLGAARDAVTGLVTRTSFLRSFECELARARRNQKPLSIVLIDIDFFKQINDCAGHATGDVVLNLIAGAICTSVRSYDLVARFAGDEFVALCCECIPDQVQLPISRIQQAISSLPLPSAFPLPQVTLSIGVASVSTVSEDLTCEALLEAADDCLYTAKRQGRNRAYCTLLEGGRRSEPRPIETLPSLTEAATQLHAAARNQRQRRSDPYEPVLFPIA